MFLIAYGDSLNRMTHDLSQGCEQLILACCQLVSDKNASHHSSSFIVSRMIWYRDFTIKLCEGGGTRMSFVVVFGAVT